MSNEIINAQEKETRLADLKQRCLSCQKCALCHTRTNLVFGVGPAQSEILFVGEGPGAEEDRLGLPFVGRSGQLLDLMLDAVDLSREKNVYIANIVKCRPPGNRDPLPEESAACMEWLDAQTAIIRPKVIVCLGRVAAARLIKPDIKIMSEHGQFIEKDGALMMATLHPAALLRNPNNKPEAFRDYLKLRDYLKK